MHGHGNRTASLHAATAGNLANGILTFILQKVHGLEKANRGLRYLDKLLKLSTYSHIFLINILINFQVNGLRGCAVARPHTIYIPSEHAVFKRFGVHAGFGPACMNHVYNLKYQVKEAELRMPRLS